MVTVVEASSNISVVTDVACVEVWWNLENLGNFVVPGV